MMGYKKKKEGSEEGKTERTSSPGVETQELASEIFPETDNPVKELCCSF